MDLETENLAQTSEKYIKRISTYWQIEFVDSDVCYLRDTSTKNLYKWPEDEKIMNSHDKSTGTHCFKEIIDHLLYFNGFPDNVKVDKDLKVQYAVVLPNGVEMVRKFSMIDRTYKYERISENSEVKISTGLNDKGSVLAALLEEFLKMETFKKFRRD